MLTQELGPISFAQVLRRAADKPSSEHSSEPHAAATVSAATSTRS
jgi:hypothetical protein